MRVCALLSRYAVLGLLISNLAACKEEASGVDPGPPAADASTRDRPSSDVLRDADGPAPDTRSVDTGSLVDTAADSAPADSSAVADSAAADSAVADSAAPVNQTPPQGRRLLDPWLAAGHYKAWKCESAPMSAHALAAPMAVSGSAPTTWPAGMVVARIPSERRP